MLVVFCFCKRKPKKKIYYTHATNADDHTNHANNNRSLYIFFVLIFFSLRVKKKRKRLIIQLFNERRQNVYNMCIRTKKNGKKKEINVIGFAYSSKKKSEREQSMMFVCVEKYKRKEKNRTCDDAL